MRTSSMLGFVESRLDMAPDGPLSQRIDQRIGEQIIIDIAGRGISITEQRSCLWWLIAAHNGCGGFVRRYRWLYGGCGPLLGPIPMIWVQMMMWMEMLVVAMMMGLMAVASR